MSLASTLSRYLSANASVTQLRMTRQGTAKTLTAVNGTDTTPLQLSIWPLTKTWKMHGGGTYTGERLQDQFQYAISQIDYDLQPGDVLQDYPKSDDRLEVASINRYDDGSQPLPHIGGILRKYSHAG